MSFRLSENRKALAAIVLPDDATAQERYATSELRHYLEHVTSAVFSLAEAPFSGAQLAIGRAADAFVPADDTLGEDGFAITTGADYVAIQGGKRGVIYGVYEWLEAIGCRFFTATCEQVPCTPTLDAPDLTTRQTPQFEYRTHNYYEYSVYPRFAVKHRLNGNNVPIQEKHGGHMPYLWFVHTMNNIIPADVYGEEHPEYYALYDGKRVVDPERTQLCLTNPEVVALAIENVRKALQAHPEARIISISQLDWMPGCQCEQCLAVDREEGSPAGTLLRFVNAIAEAFEPEFPDVIFDTLAYQYTRPVPKITHPRHNVCVRLCSIECCFSHPFETCDDDTRGVTLPDGTRSSFIKDLHDWGDFHDRLYIWDYTTCFAHYPAPYPNWRTLQPNMQTFARCHVKGMFEQATGARRGGVDFNELRAYIISKLMWNPWCDVQKHIAEFTDYYYGAGGEYVRAFINALCDKAEKDNIHVGFNDNLDTPLYSEDMLDVLEGFLRKAEEAVQGDALRMWRIGKAKLGVRYVRMKRAEMLRGESDPEEINSFFSDWNAYGLSRINEWVSNQTTLRAFLDHKWRGEAYYAHWTMEGPEEF